ncbi:D-glycero-beta-D-manno-heptose 1,7-bisphosphate 7-phosphatase [Acidovorax sp.]|jgi:D-glycero-D-manno-heptose 1,7-bisphosphate phosphatase|uniref:D-glycero-beta-D-manno-heptose 1,7-bisphosphate 7-phosphatase n=1 Tax=Acidovorax sp. TaxID=1872122 RepID=UPI0025C12081|nr:D-glycero-beta-D-manno-heptose 1,7-bisphosphate 7-phosphatase [Acidovorax sp.]
MKLAILDRDGTLNPLGDDFITSPEEWSAQPGALEAVARLNHAGWRVVVATNQPGLGRGLFDVVSLNAIHAKMLRQVAAVGGRIDAVFYCPHAPDEACHCRTPAPGLLEQICDRYGVEPFDARVVGSCAEHLQAGAALGAQVHLVCTGRSAHLQPGQALPIEFPATTRVHASLAELVEHLLPPTPAPQPTPALAPATATLSGTPPLAY